MMIRLSVPSQALLAASLVMTLATHSVDAFATSDTSTIVVGEYSIPRQLDPAKQKQGEEWALAYLIFDGLTDLDRNMVVHPLLAKSWKSSSDLTEWTFELQQGVEFHNGNPFTSDDVVATFQRVLDPKSGSAGLGGISMVQQVRAEGPYTVVFTLKFPYAELPQTLSDRWYKIVDRRAIDSLSTRPIGTGPYKFSEYTVGQQAVLVKNAKYWQKGIPKTDRIVFKILPEPIVAVTALEKGEIDLLFQTPLEQTAQLKRNPDVVVDFVPTTGFDMIVMNVEHPPFDNPKVRLALKYATNKTELVTAALFGHGSPTITPITHIPDVEDPSLTDIRQDFAKAKTLLAEAGFKDGLNAVLYVPEGRPTRKALGIALEQMWKPAGVNVTLKTVPWDKFITDIEYKAPLYTDGYRGFPTADASIYPFLHSGGSLNVAHWKNPKMDQLLDDARRTVDKQKRHDLYTKIQELARDEGAIIFPYVLQNSDSYRRNLHGFQTTPMLLLNLRQAYKTKE